MLNIKENDRLEGIEIYSFVETKTRYRDWLKRCIEYADLKENEDYFCTLKDSTGGRQAKEYEFTLNAAKEICIVSATSKAKELRRWLIELSNQKENLELISVKQAAFAFKVINCLKYIDNQKEAYGLHQKAYMDKNFNILDQKYLYAEFAKYRNKIVGWSKEKTTEAINEFLVNHIGYPKQKLLKSNMQVQLSVLDIGEAIRVAVLDILYSQNENETLSEKFSVLCKNLAKEMEVQAEKSNTTNLFRVNENIESIKQISLK